MNKFETLKSYVEKNVKKFQYRIPGCFESEAFIYKDFKITRSISIRVIFNFFSLNTKEIVKEHFKIFIKDISVKYTQEEYSILWNILKIERDKRNKLYNEKLDIQREEKILDFFKEISNQ